MTLKLLGAFFIIAGCGWFGMSVASAHRREEVSLRRLIAALDYMECELQYRMSALPDLFRSTAGECEGILRTIFLQLANEVDQCVATDVNACMKKVISSHMSIPSTTLEGLMLLGSGMGRFDLTGQLNGLQHVRQICRENLTKINQNADVRRRSYQTLGLCAGAALVIIFI